MKTPFRITYSLSLTIDLARGTPQDGTFYVQARRKTESCRFTISTQGNQIFGVSGGNGLNQIPVTAQISEHYPQIWTAFKAIGVEIPEWCTTHEKVHI